MTLGTGAAVILAVGISLADLISPFLEPGSREARRAQEHYRNEEWVEAIEELQSAVTDQEDPALSYNLGAASYKAQNYPEAAKAYAAAIQGGEIDPARIAYDQGNVLYRSGELQAALESYRTALRADPADEDARFNYEVTLRQLQEGEEEDQEQEPGDQGENEQQDENQEQNSDAPQDSTGQSQQDQQQGEGEDQPEDQQGEGEEGEDQQQGSGGEEDQQPPQDGKGGQAQKGQLLSPEEAERLLNAITPEERELIKARLRSSKRQKVEKDW